MDVQRRFTWESSKADQMDIIQYPFLDVLGPLENNSTIAMCSNENPNKKYIVGNVLGKGGFATVYAGVRIEGGAPVAIKKVEKNKITDWSFLNGKKVPIELKLLNSVEGVEGVIKLLDFYERHDSFIYVMERPNDCKDLFDFISESEKKYLEESLAKNFFHQIVSIVVSCHKKGVFHRDIKDENILVDINSGKLKLIDFGSGVLMDDENQIYTEFIGTGVYAPPEWYMKRKYKGGSATVWSLGILLYVMVCGDIPWERKNEICVADLIFNRELSSECKDLISCCLTRAIDRRIDINKILHHPWFQDVKIKQKN